MGDACPRLVVTVKALRSLTGQDHMRTPVYLAAKFGFVDILRALLADPRVDSNRANLKGRTALHAAALRNQFAAVTELLNDPRTLVNVKDPQGRSAFHCVVIERKYEMLAHMLQHASRILVNQVCGPSNSSRLRCCVVAVLLRLVDKTSEHVPCSGITVTLRKRRTSMPRIETTPSCWRYWAAFRRLSSFISNVVSYVHRTEWHE